MDKIKVIHKGDKKKNIEGTGQVRFMGTLQFEKYGKQNGWKEAPATAQVKAATTTKDATKSEDKDTGTEGAGAEATADTVNVGELNATNLIAKIKELGAAGDLITIAQIKTDEEAADDTRSTVITAADKYLNAKED